MNKLSVALNLILIAAIGYLYYYNFSGKKNDASNSSTGIGQRTKDSCTTMHRIAYVDLDSLNENLVYFKLQRKDLETQQKQMEAEINNDYKDLKEKEASFYQKNPNASPEQLQGVRALLQRGEDSLEIKRQKMSEIMNGKRFVMLDNIQKTLKIFLNTYNLEKKYQYILTTGGGMDYLIYKDSTLNITNDVIKGMNERMKPTGQ